MSEHARTRLDRTAYCFATRKLLAAMIFLMIVCPPDSNEQDRKAANPAAELPNILLLVHQEIQRGQASALHKLELSMKRACDRLSVPNSWIHLQSLTGPSEVVFFDAFDSFDEVEQSYSQWAQLYALHPDLARMHEEI